MEDYIALFSFKWMWKLVLYSFPFTKLYAYKEGIWGQYKMKRIGKMSLYTQKLFDWKKKKNCTV